MKERAGAIGTRGWVALSFLTLLWSSSYLLYRVLDRSFAPAMVACGRLIIAALLLNLILLARRTPLKVAPKRWPAFLFLGFLNNAVPNTLIAFSETRITGGLAATIGATAPLFGILPALMRERTQFEPQRLGALLIGLLGVAVATGAVGAFASTPDASAVGAVLLAAIFYAMGSAYSVRFSAGRPLEVAAGQLLAAAIIMLGFVAATGSWPSQGSLSTGNLLGLLAIGSACTALPYVIYYRVLGRLGPSNTLLTTMMIPAASILLAWLLLREPIVPRKVAGMGLIVIALLIIDGTLRSRMRERYRRTAVSRP